MHTNYNAKSHFKKENTLKTNTINAIDNINKNLTRKNLTKLT